MKKILLTGASGKIGTSLRKLLSSNYHFRCLDTIPTVNEKDVIAANVLDFPSILEAMEGVKAVIHLAADTSLDQSWEYAQSAGIAGTYNVFVAARLAGVSKVIFASSISVLGYRKIASQDKVPPNAPYHPDTFYGIAKTTGELLAQYYTETYVYQ